VAAIVLEMAGESEKERGGAYEDIRASLPLVLPVRLGGTRRVRLVREEGRGVSSQYGRRDEACPVSTGGRVGGGGEVRRAERVAPAILHAAAEVPPVEPCAAAEVRKLI